MTAKPQMMMGSGAMAAMPKYPASRAQMLRPTGSSHFLAVDGPFACFFGAGARRSSGSSSRNSPQKRHLTAVDLISSPQYGQGWVAGVDIDGSFACGAVSLRTRHDN